MTIRKVAESGIGWRCWKVFASVPGSARRVQLAGGLTKQRANRFVARVTRLCDSQGANGVPDGSFLKLGHDGGVGHGHWCLVWDVQANRPIRFACDLPLQSAQKARDELNEILRAVYELRLCVFVAERLRVAEAQLTAVISRGGGRALDAVSKVIEELKTQIRGLE